MELKDAQRLHDAMESPEYWTVDPEPVVYDVSQKDIDNFCDWPNEYYELQSRIDHLLIDSGSIIVGPSGQGYVAEELAKTLKEYQSIIRKHMGGK